MTSQHLRKDRLPGRGRRGIRYVEEKVPSDVGRHDKLAAILIGLVAMMMVGILVAKLT